MSQQGTHAADLDTTLRGPQPSSRPRLEIEEQTIEIVSDSGEGAQTVGQAFGTVCAKMGNGVWTVEIIPAEIRPPARSRAGASGIRVRFGSKPIRNMGDAADLVVAFNEQVLYGRIDADAYRPGTTVLLDDHWSEDLSDEVQEQYRHALLDFERAELDVRPLPLEAACRAALPTAPVGRLVGKNMFVLGVLCEVFNRDLDRALEEVRFVFGRKGQEVVERNQHLVREGYAFAARELPFAYEVPPAERERPLVVMNGNQAIGAGILAAGIDVVSMYPITPATSISHYLAQSLPAAGGVVHQAEDEIAAIGFAVGASYAGKTACTITSGPGFALKTEFLGLAVMGEIPLVIIEVQRGGPSTGLPTKVEQGDLLASLFGQPGDAPKIVLSPSTVEECFHFVILARRLAEEFRTPVVVLSDANLATGVQPFPRPHPQREWLAPAPASTPWPQGKPPYDWNLETGISQRPIPGQEHGEYVLTGLAHTTRSKVAYDAHSNQEGCERRSKKLLTLAQTLRPPTVYGEEQGELLLVGWGSTRGAIEEAVDRLRQRGASVSALHLRFMSPLEPGLEEIFARFDRVMTVEINYSDDADTVPPERRRLAQLALLLRARTLVDVDCWSRVSGQPLRPGQIVDEIERRLGVAGRALN